ncbi:hypothetical protein ACX0GZ_04650 [Sphingomonas aestuarii]
MADRSIEQIAASAEELTLTFGEVETILGARFMIDPDRHTAFRGRLQNLQRKGFPAGVNTGKGTPAVYGFAQLADMMLVFSFIDLGMLPDQAVELANSIRDKFLSEVKDYFWLIDVQSDLETALSMMEDDKIAKFKVEPHGKMLVIYPNSLGVLKERSQRDPEVYFLAIQDIRDELGDHAPFSSAPHLVIPIGELVMRMLMYIALIRKWDGKRVARSFIRWATEYDRRTSAVDTKA